MANHPDILPERMPTNDDDGMFRLVLSEKDLALVLSRPGNSQRQMRLTIERNRSTVVTCQVGSRMKQGTRAHFEASLRFFLHAARAAVQPTHGDEVLDDLKATVVAMDVESLLDYVVTAPLPWKAGEAFIRVKGVMDALTGIEMPSVPFAAALTCVHDFQGVSIRVDPLNFESDPDMDTMERLRLLRRASLRTTTPTPRQDPA